MPLSLKSICKSYAGVPVFSELTIDFVESGITVITGPSGCGKTTILKLISGIELPDSGEIVGQNAARISVVFQEARLLPWFNVLGNLKFALGGFPKEEREARARKYLETVGLSEYANHRPSTLSGGMRQRISLARAFAYPSDLILMDEAFQSLDIAKRHSLMMSFLDLWEAEKKTAILVTHAIDEASFLADRIIVLGERPAKVEAVLDIDRTNGERSFASPEYLRTESLLRESLL